jgi:chromosome partitioning protein
MLRCMWGLNLEGIGLRCMTFSWGIVRFGEVRQEVYPRFWVIPSDLDLAAAEVELAGVVGREMILRDKLQEDHPPLDYLLVDCPPSLGVLTLNALTAVREVIIPLQPHFLALHGLGKLLETIELVLQTA